MELQQFEKTDMGLKVRAPAKINLSLLIAGKRPDGYHEIDTIMTKIDLFDELIFVPGGEGGLELICSGQYKVNSGPDNLITNAHHLICDTIGRILSVRIHLRKNIPVGAGLGGGSSDAAATLLGLNRLFEIGLDQKAVWKLASQLGSDVAFFLGGPLALCRGRGEKIKEIRSDFHFQAILILPDISVSTRMVYENYEHDKEEYKRLCGSINSLLTKKKIDSVAQMCTNMLETSCFALHGELAKLKSRIESLGFGPVCLSGSGSAMYCLPIGTTEDIERCQSILHERIGCRSVIVNNIRW
ncbi:MAG: 4-(cytidine 5'-diphospho)-2-C-methyl-D-erythritol kinase [Sedimentisphaerales bacterium]|nr:4-(cytidine 5'-diphospho)-2-C-methyl-D-erythritol kinase [Sedimentisphaerales bacterium]